MLLDKYNRKQKMAYDMITNEIKNNELSHAYIIESNKYRDTDDFIFCMLSDIYGDPKLYDAIKNNNFPDVKIIEPEHYEYKKEELINLEKEFSTKPICDKYKIYVIKKANKLNDITSNTILKFVEEPENGIIAFLVVDNMYQLIDTLISRCQVISLNNNNQYEKTIENFFIVNNLTCDSEEQAVLEFENLIKFAMCMEKYKKDAIIYEKKYFTNIFKTKSDYYTAFEILVCIYKQVLNIKNETPVDYLNKYMDVLNKIADNNDVYKVIDKMMILIEAQKEVVYNLNLNLLLDNTIIKMGEVVNDKSN